LGFAGTGAAGTVVYYGIHKDFGEVAVKRLVRIFSQEHGDREVELLAQLATQEHFKHVVRWRGQVRRDFASVQ